MDSSFCISLSTCIVPEPTATKRALQICPEALDNVSEKFKSYVTHNILFFDFVPIYTYSYPRYLEQFNFCSFLSFYMRVVNKWEDMYQFYFSYVIELIITPFYEFLKIEAGKEVSPKARLFLFDLFGCY